MRLLMTSLVILAGVCLLVESQNIRGRRRRIGGGGGGRRGGGGGGRRTRRPRTTTAAPQPCPPIPHIDNGQGLDTGSTVRYACEPGYVLEGTNVITCINGRWTVAPRCTRQICPRPPNVPFANEPTLSNGGVTATYTCLPGYRIIGGNGVTSTMVTCNTQSQFWPNLPACEPIPIVSCAGPPSILNALSTVSGSTATYTCVAGYSLRAGTPSTIICTGGVWPSTNLPFCVAGPSITVKCTKAPPCGDATITRDTAGDSYVVGGSVMYTCATGYRIVGSNDNKNNSASVYCMADGTWTTTPTCEPVVCGVPPAGTNTVPVVASSIVYPNSYTYVCNTNYESGTSLESKCLADGTWSLTPAPTCTQKMCNMAGLPTLADADVLRQNVPIGGTVDYTCRLSFRLAPATPTSTDRVQTVTCQADGTFTALTQTCVYIRPESCRDYFARDNLFAAATTTCVTVILDPEGADLSDPTNPPEFSAECCKTSATDYCTQVAPSAGANANLALPCLTAAAPTATMPSTTFIGPDSAVCGPETAVTYPITNAQIVSMIGSTSGTCSQQTSINCVAGTAFLAFALRVNGETSGFLYGTAAYDPRGPPPLPPPPPATMIELSNYAYANAPCDCGVTGALITVPGPNACNQGCACARIALGGAEAMDTITKQLTSARPAYVTSYAFTTHDGDAAPPRVANDMRAAVGPIRCCETF